jgi:hypothetical protein
VKKWHDLPTLDDTSILTPKELRHIAQGCRALRLPWAENIVVFYPERVAQFLRFGVGESLPKNSFIVFNLVAVMPDLAIDDGTLSGYNNCGNLAPG